MQAFLETTAIVDLLFRSRAATKELRKILASYDETSTSQYVKMEMKRGPLTYLVALYNKTVDCKTIREVFDYTSRLNAGPARHKLGMVIQTLGTFFERLDTRLTVSDEKNIVPARRQKLLLEAFLRTKIRRAWRAFDKQVSVVIDETECYKSLYQLQPPVQVGTKFDNTFRNCDDFKPGICRIRPFYNQNKSSFIALKRAIQQLPEVDKETRKRLAAVKRAIRLPNREVPRSRCWDAGDANIVVESPRNADLITRNFKHFHPLGRALGKNVIKY